MPIPKDDEGWIARARCFPPARTIVVHPVDALSLAGVVAAEAAGVITPVLVGPAHRIESAAEDAGLALSGMEIVDTPHSHAAAAALCDYGASRNNRNVDTPHSHAAAAAGVELLRQARGAVLMKGSLHTDELMHEVVQPEAGLRTERRLSHVYVMQVATYGKTLFVTDAAINIFPDLDDKRDIVQNAIDLAVCLGVAQPKVAILSAVETINPKLPSTIEAAALCKIADRGQITDGLLDGPLALDNAIAPEAARTKNLNSPVAGNADILVVPDLEAGNMLAKNLTFMANADAAGIVLGARVPIVLTSRADDTDSRVKSCAIASLYAQETRTRKPVAA